MRHEELTLTGRNGVPLWGQQWRPDTGAVGAVVITHGYAEHIGRYRELAEALAGAGWAVLAVDQRGHGRSGGRRAITDRLEWLLADLDLVVDAAGALTGTAPVLLGHSMGGGVAAAYALDHQEKLTALVLSGPALGMRAALPAWQVALLPAVSAVAPRAPTAPVRPETVSRDPGVVAAYREDPLVFHGKVPARTAREMLRASDLVARRAGELRLPLLIVHGSDDQVVSVDGSRALFAAAGSADKTLTVYDGWYHEVFNEPERDRALAELVAWLGSHRPAGVP